jgi:hypothetical protein
MVAISAGSIYTKCIAHTYLLPHHFAAGTATFSGKKILDFCFFSILVVAVLRAY